MCEIFKKLPNWISRVVLFPASDVGEAVVFPHPLQHLVVSI